MTGTPRRMLAVWIAQHENGWVTAIAEQPGGTWAAWAAPIGEPRPVAEYIEDGPEYARAAAEFALKVKTGHDGCGALCSEWELHTRFVDTEG